MNIVEIFRTFLGHGKTEEEAGLVTAELYADYMLMFVKAITM